MQEHRFFNISLLCSQRKKNAQEILLYNGSINLTSESLKGFHTMKQNIRENEIVIT